MAAGCDYEAQLLEACRLVIERIDRPLPWRLAWQSRSGPPQVPWLEPDVNDEIASLAAGGVEAVVIVPIGFVSDHMEVAWDLDIQATATANDHGVTIRRAISPGTAPDPAFIAMWASWCGVMRRKGREIKTNQKPCQPDDFFMREPSFN